MTQGEKKTKRLFAVWKVFFGLLSIATSISMGYLQGICEIDVQSMPSVFQLLLIAIIMFIFFPLLVLIRKSALLHNVSDVAKKSTKLLLALGIACIVTLICNILSFFIPGLF